MMKLGREMAGEDMTKIKICGLRRKEDIAYVNEYKPDYIGFVFAKKSKRYVAKEKVVILKSLLLPEILAVGVFVNEDIAYIEELVRDGVIDVVQLHGEEDNAYIANLRKRVPHTKIIKAIKVAAKEDVLKSKEIMADYLLFDSFSAKEQGGTGKVFDWSLLGLLEEVDKPYFLAGGIRLDNVGEALQRVKPYGVDVSSGVETEGYKDKTKIQLLMQKIKGYENRFSQDN